MLCAMHELTDKERQAGYIREGVMDGRPVVFLPNGTFSYRDDVARSGG